jgi:hypothetical protein
MSASQSVGDRVPHHLGGLRDRKSVSRINTSVSGGVGLRIKIVFRQGIILRLWVIHRYGSCDPGPSEGLCQSAGMRTSDRALPPIPQADSGCRCDVGGRVPEPRQSTWLPPCKVLPLLGCRATKGEVL